VAWRFVAGMPQLGVAVLWWWCSMASSRSSRRAGRARRRAARDRCPLVTVIRDGVPVPIPAADVVVAAP
jgi:hypothetical protein